MVSTSRKKSSNKRILFQVDRRSVSTSRNEKFVKECLYYTRNCSEISKKIVAIAVIRALTSFNFSNIKDKVCF